jgi:hypothetical protein
MAETVASKVRNSDVLAIATAVTAISSAAGVLMLGIERANPMATARIQAFALKCADEGMDLYLFNVGSRDALRTKLTVTRHWGRSGFVNGKPPADVVLNINRIPASILKAKSLTLLQIEYEKHSKEEKNLYPDTNPEMQTSCGHDVRISYIPVEIDRAGWFRRLGFGATERNGGHRESGAGERYVMASCPCE